MSDFLDSRDIIDDIKKRGNFNSYSDIANKMKVNVSTFLNWHNRRAATKKVLDKLIRFRDSLAQSRDTLETPPNRTGSVVGEDRTIKIVPVAPPPNSADYWRGKAEGLQNEVNDLKECIKRLSAGRDMGPALAPSADDPKPVVGAERKT